MSLEVVFPSRVATERDGRWPSRRVESTDQMSKTSSIDFDTLVTRFASATATGVATILPLDQHVDKDYLDLTGFQCPLLVRSPAQLNLVVPQPDTMSLQDLETAIGSERPVRAIDVASQRELPNEMKLKEWMQYFGQAPTQRDQVLNLISLECTGTGLGKLVRQPKVVGEIGWVEKHWAAVGGSNARKVKELALKPKVGLYCLMSAGGSYTEAHVDFGGSSVWYHLYKGRKYFFVVPPTAANLDKFDQWEGTYKHGTAPFFGDLVPQDECTVVEMHAGDTMMLPSGWIHAVYTPEDSIAFGGNFLSGYHMATHLHCHAKEKRQQIEGRFFFPEFECAVWYAVAYYAKMLSTCPSMLTKWEWQGLQVLVQGLEEWLSGKSDGLTGAPDPAVLYRVEWICSTAVKNSTPSTLLKKMATAVEAVADKLRLASIEDDGQGKDDTNADSSETANAPVGTELNMPSTTSPVPVQVSAVEVPSDSIARVATHDSSSSSSSSSDEVSSDSSDSSSVESSDGEDTGKESDHQHSGAGGDDNGDTNESSSDSSSDDDSSSSSSSDNEEENSKVVEDDKEEPKKEEEPEEFDEPEESSSDDSDDDADPESAYPELSPVPVDALIAIRKRAKLNDFQISKKAKEQVIAMARQHIVERQKNARSKKKSAKSNSKPIAVITPWAEDAHWVVSCSCGLGGDNYDDGREMIECDNCQTWVHIGCVSIPIHKIFWCHKCRASEEWLFVCSCGVKEKNFDDGVRMVQCNLCETWQHTKCGGVPDTKEPPEVYECTNCREVKKSTSRSQRRSKKTSKKKSAKNHVVAEGMAGSQSTSTVPPSPPMDASSPPPPPPPPPSAPPSPDPSLYEEPTGRYTSPEILPQPVQKRKRGRPPLGKSKVKKSMEFDEENHTSDGPGSPVGVNGTSLMMRPPLPMTPKSSVVSGKRKSGGSARDRLEKKLKSRKSRG